MTYVINATGEIISWIITLYCWVIFIGAILILARADPYSQFMQIIDRLTSPAYNFIKRFVRTDFNGLDFAPLILIIILQFINLTIAKFLMQYH